VDGLLAELDAPAGSLDWLRRHDDAQIAALHAAVVGAVRRQEQAIDSALDAVVRFVPRLLRPRVARLLFPGGRRG
jgi:hypothetical protein